METSEITSKTVLLSVLIMKKLPLKWFYRLSESYEIKRYKLVNIIQNLLKSGCIMVREDVTGESYVFLTRKGYNKANSKVITPYRYRDWSRYENLSLSGDEHRFCLFRFFFDYSLHFSPTLVLPDHYKYSRLEYSLIGRNPVWVSPDMLIKTGNNGICVEADMGTESPKRILEKLLHYSMYLLKDFNDEGIETLQIYFIFPSSDRLEHVFLKNSENVRESYSELQLKSSIFSFLEPENTSFKVSKDKNAKYLSISTRDFLRLFMKSRIKVFAGVAKQHVNEFGEVNFVGLVGLVKNWQIKEKEERKEVEI